MPPPVVPQTYFNYDFNQPNPYLAAMTADQNPFLSEPPEFTPGSSYQNYNFAAAPTAPAPAPSNDFPIVRLCDDQIQHIIRELTIATSSRSSGDSASSVNDQSIVPHISSVFESIAQFKITLSQLAHDVCILNGRVFHHNESVMDRILREIDSLKAKIENFETKADWVEHRVRSSESQTRDAASAVAQWTSSLIDLSQLVKTHIAMTAAPGSGASHSHPHLWSPPSQPVKQEPSPVGLSSDSDN